MPWTAQRQCVGAVHHKPDVPLRRSWITSVLTWLNRRTTDRCKAKELYGAIVTQARAPEFYAVCGVEDTPEGRYEMIVLHLFLLLARLRTEASPGQDLAQHVLEAFVTDMDDSLREMGVGDLAVPKKVKRAAAGFYERARAYGAALSGPDNALAAELAASLPGVAGQVQAATALATYVRRAQARLGETASRYILDGRVTFPATEFTGVASGQSRENA
jgi:cytochrome b pre-mRNA-processing protein 3